jgi:ATP-dependent Clp protease ATP-binding subunit ClpB
MTSNVGAKRLSLLPEGVESNTMKKEVMTDLRNHFSPEFINRIDDIIIFNRLSKSNLDQILKIRIEDIKNKLIDKKISLILTNEAKGWICENGYDIV